MSTDAAPLRLLRLVTLFSTFAFSVAGVGLLGFAFQQGKDEKNLAKSTAAAVGIDADVDISNLLNPGYATAAACGLLVISTGFSFITLLAAPRFNNRLLKFEVPNLIVITLFLFGSVVALTVRVAKDSSSITATAQGQPVPTALVLQLASTLGIQPIYHKIGYVINSTVIPWIAFLFGAIQTVLSFSASRSAADVGSSSPESTDSLEKKEITEA